MAHIGFFLRGGGGGEREREREKEREKKNLTYGGVQNGWGLYPHIRFWFTPNNNNNKDICLTN